MADRSDHQSAPRDEDEGENVRRLNLSVDAQFQASGAEPVALLEQSLWRKLTRGGETEDLAKSWAPLMHRQVRTAECTAVFLRPTDGGRIRPIASFPEARMAGSSLIAAAEEATFQKRGVVRGAVNESGQTTGGLVSIASPVMVEGDAVGAVGTEIDPRDQGDMRDAMRQLQWGAAWMRDALRRDRAVQDTIRYGHAVEALNTVVGVAEPDRIATATRAAVTGLATRFDCDRVSLGFRRRMRATKVAAVSHSAGFGKRMNLIRLIAAAMDEAVDQRGPVLWPPERSETAMASTAAEALAKAQGVGNILTVPLYAAGAFIGAMTFERPAERPFEQSEVEILEAIATVLAPIVEEKRRNDRWLITKAFEAAGGELKRIFGPSHLGRKLTLVGVMLLTAFLLVAKGADRINADATVEGAIVRTVASPVDGFIAESFARAGDLVSEGQVLVRLDDRDLALERLRLVTGLQRQRVEYDRALAERDRAESQVRNSQIEQTEAEIALIDKQMERMTLIAPFDGLVISGDLSQEIGAAVVRGEPLLTVSPSADYRVALAVDERRIADISLGQTGTLVPTALPDRAVPFEITMITPVADYGGGATTFRVEGTLTEAAADLRPGMEGVAKVDTGEELLLTIWTRPIVDWARLVAWRWLSTGAEDPTDTARD